MIFDEAAQEVGCTRVELIDDAHAQVSLRPAQRAIDHIAVVEVIGDVGLHQLRAVDAAFVHRCDELLARERQPFRLADVAHRRRIRAMRAVRNLRIFFAVVGNDMDMGIDDHLASLPAATGDAIIPRRSRSWK